MRFAAAMSVRLVSVCAVSLVLIAGGAASGRDFWVSVAGNDGDAGTNEKPFATLERARDAIREAKKAGPFDAATTVWLRGGVYRIGRTFALDAQDSGAAEAPVVYRSAPGEVVRLVGGQQLPTSAFKLVTDDAGLKRLAPTAHGKVMRADLKALGI